MKRRLRRGSNRKKERKRRQCFIKSGLFLLILFLRGEKEESVQGTLIRSAVNN